MRHRTTVLAVVFIAMAVLLVPLGFMFSVVTVSASGGEGPTILLAAGVFIAFFGILFVASRLFRRH